MLAFAFTILLGLSTAFSAPTNITVSPRPCGNLPNMKDVQRMESTFARDMAKTDVTAQSALIGDITIPIYFHVISAGPTKAQGNVSNTDLYNQIQVLNQAFERSQVWFRLAEIDRTTNVQWFVSAGPSNAAQTAMKNQLRKGGANALNVYTVGFQSGTGSGMLGYATFPSSYAAAPKDDGIVIRYSTLPYGTVPGFDMGKNLVHQVGHWMGLYHTFQGGCTGAGDMVHDTPPQASPTSGCPLSRDSCPGGAEDFVINYMDNSDDYCRLSFTYEQTKRFRSQIATYRGITAKTRS